MDNFKAFQLTTEEAMNVTGQGRGFNLKKRLSRYSEEDRASIKISITNLKAADGWKDLSRKEKNSELKRAIKLFDQGIIIVNGPFVN